jgi:hypothetical protein
MALTTKKQAIHLTKEVLALRELNSRHPYQVKFDKSRWKDLALPIKSLEQLVDEVNEPLVSVKLRNFIALPVIHHMNLEFHNASKETDARVVDVTDEDYVLESFQDDVVKISYKFMICYANKHETEKAIRAEIRNAKPQSDPYRPIKSKVFNPNAPKMIQGQFTIMPGN